jgi:hypothetical protein
MNKWHFLHGLFDALFVRIGGKLNAILAEQQKMEVLLMSTISTIKDFAAKVDAITNLIAANIDVIKAKLVDLQAQITTGSISPTELANALDPLTVHLQSASDALAAVAAGGEPVVPPAPAAIK